MTTETQTHTTTFADPGTAMEAVDLISPINQLPAGDITSLFASGKPGKMPIRDPKSKSPMIGQNGKPMALFIADKDSEPCRLARVENERLYPDGVKNNTPEQLQTIINVVAASIQGFENIVKDGELVVYSPAAARELVEMSPEIRDQVLKFLGANENFMRGA